MSQLVTLNTRNYKKNLIIFLCYLALSFLYFLKAFTNSLLIAPGDSWIQNYPLHIYYADLLKNGEFSFWLPFEFLGTSLIGIMQTGILYPINIFYLIFPYDFAYNFILLLHFSLGAYFVYLYIRRLHINTFAAFVGGLIFGFSGFLMAHKGHTSMMNAAIWLPLLLYCFERIRTELKLKYSLIAGIVIAIQIFAGHFQISVYTLLFLGFYTLFYTFSLKGKQVINFLVLTLTAVLVGVLIGLPQIISSFELTQEAWRLDLGYSYFTEYSFPLFMIITFIFPFFFGGGYGGVYWGAQNATELINFIGTLPLVLGIYIVAVRWKQNFHIKFWGCSTALTFIMALGGSTPIYKVFYYVPVYNLFRVPARNFMEMNLAIAVLLAFGLSALFHKKDYLLSKIESFKFIKVFIGVMLCSVAFLIACKNLLMVNWPINLLSEDAHNLLSNTLRLDNKAIYIPLLIMCGYLIALLAYYKTNSKQIKYLVALLILLEAFSYGRYHDNYWVSNKEIQETINSGTLTYLKEQGNIDRSFFLNDMSPNLFNVPLKVNKLNGYDPLINKNLHDLLDMNPSGDTPSDKQLISNNLILSMLNARYIVTGHDLSEYKGSLENHSTKKSINLHGWEHHNVDLKNGEYIFNIKSVEGISIIQQEIPVKPNTYYTLKLKANSNNASDFLIADLYGEGYDSGEQEITISNADITSESKEFSKVFNSGDVVPEIVNLRVFTFSTNPISVKDIELVEHEYTPPLLKGQKETTLYNPVYEEPETGVRVYENSNYLEKVYAVDKLVAMDALSEIKNSFLNFDINPSNTAIVSTADLKEIGKSQFADGTVTIESYRNDSVWVKTNFSGEGFVIIADQYSPGWKAFVNGKPTDIYEVNGLVRGVVVPEGEHNLQFVYSPSNLIVSLWASAILLLLVIAILSLPKISLLFVKFRR